MTIDQAFKTIGCACFGNPDELSEAFYTLKKAIESQQKTDDLVAILTEIQMEIEEHEESIIGNYGKETTESDFPSHRIERNNGRKECVDLIQQRINELKGRSGGVNERNI